MSTTIVLVEPMQVAIKSTALTHAFVIQDTGTAVTTVLPLITVVKTLMAVTRIQIATILDLESTGAPAHQDILEMGLSVLK